MILLLCDDLLFASRITGTARGLNHPIRSAKTPNEIVAAARETVPSCVLLDLSNPNLVVVEVLRQLREVCQSMPFVAAFGSHVDNEVLKAARDAGCDVVWPRSKFAEELATALPVWVERKPIS